MKKFLVLALLGGMFVSGCGGGGTGDHASLGSMRFIAASPDAPSMDVYVNGSKEVTALPYLGFSYYLNYNQGSEHVQFRTVNGGVNKVDFNVDLSAQQYKTVIAYNTFSNMKASVLTDDRSVPAPGIVRVRIMHLAPSAGNIDIYFNAPNVDIANVSPTNANIPFETNLGYVNIPAGSYRMIVTHAGTKNVILNTGSLDFASQEVRTIFTVDKQGGGTPLLGLIQYDVN